MSDTTLVLFCKRPALGFGKQRLAADLGEQAAFEIAVGLLACALEDLEHWPGPVVIAPHSDTEIAWAANLLRRSASVVPQSEGNLGERIEAIDRLLRGKGAGQLLVIGSDAPELNARLLAQAVELLADHDAVFAAAEDGGVSLMANRKPWPELKPMPWSTPQLGASLQQLCERAGQRVGWSAPCSDVDRLDDLERVSKSLRVDPRPARQSLLAIINRWQSNEYGQASK